MLTSILMALIIWLMDYVFGIQPVPKDLEGFSWRGILGFIYNEKNVTEIK